jgi:hypothetical protein
MTISYDNHSIYQTTPQVNKNQVTYLDFWSGVIIPQTVNDKLVILDSRYQYRPDLLSFEYYQTPKLWWVFALRNPDVIKDPIWDFKTGITIYVSDKSAIKRFL